MQPCPRTPTPVCSRNYIGGRWVASTSTDQLDVQNPATGETLARVPLSGAADVDTAVKAARAAFPEWRRRPTIERARWMFGFRQVVEAHADELARSVTREMGKTLPDARAEVGRAIEMIEAASAIPQTMQGRILENVATGVDCETIRQPVGVVRGDRAVQLPGDGAVLVPAVRDRLRQHVRAEALRAGAAHAGARLQPDRRDAAGSRTASSTS